MKLPIRLQALVAACALSLPMLTVGSLDVEAQPIVEQSVPGWLARINSFRAEHGLAPVRIEPSYNAATNAYACWQSVYGIGYYGSPGSPGWNNDVADGWYSGLHAGSTTGGDPVDFVEDWIESPYHAHRLLRPDWHKTSMNVCSNTRFGKTTWAATIDVRRGVIWNLTTVNRDMVSPPNGSTTSRTSWDGSSPDPEYPDARGTCGYSGSVGLPLVAYMPKHFPVTGSRASVTLNGPNGPVEHCVLWRGKPTRDLPVEESFKIDARAVLILPRSPLRPGRYNVSVNVYTSIVEQSKSWSFTVNQTMKCRGRTVTIAGTPGNDRIRGTNGPDVINGLGGNDVIEGLGGNDVICGGPGNDVVAGGGGNDTLYGEPGDDRLEAGSGDDVVYGDRGRDRLYGEGGNDELRGGPESDQVFGQDGNDLLMGGEAGDKINGGNGDDRIEGHQGDDWLAGGVGNDTIAGHAGNDKLYGSPGNDRLFGDLGNDSMWAGKDNDNVRGGPGNDALYGEAGADFLAGEQGNDRLIGGGQNDRSFGGPGDDFLDGQAGSDRDWGGLGRDTCRSERRLECEA